MFKFLPLSRCSMHVTFPDSQHPSSFAPREKKMPWILVYDQTTSRPCFDCLGKSPCSAWSPLKGRLTPELFHCVCITDEGTSTETQTLKNLKWHHRAKKRGMNVFYWFPHCADKRFPFMWNPKSAVLSQKHTKPGLQVNITHWIREWMTFYML